MSTVQSKRGGQRLVLHGESWETYLRLLRIFHERHLRITYDRGTLEIMTLTHEHENDNRFLALLVIILTQELGLPVKQGGSNTMKRRRRQRGLEPDSCFWIANEPLVRSKTRIDWQVDPPPDLALEIDVSRSSVNRLGIYEALRVPEVWRFDGQMVIFYVLGADGRYTQSASSRAFLGLKPADLVTFLAMRGQTDENSIFRQFQQWVRQNLVGGGASQPAP